jgi:hypothetical protein
MAAMAALRTCPGVSKSGSPALREMTFAPPARRSATLSIIR